MYEFHVTEAGEPLRLHMHGSDLFTGAHFDNCGPRHACCRPGLQAPTRKWC